MKTKLELEDIQRVIQHADYVRMPDGRTTICQLTLVNGFTVRGESSCVSIENFDQHIGESMAYGDAVRQVWRLEGYLLAQRLHEERLRTV